jgi:hypothetical protein
MSLLEVTIAMSITATVLFAAASLTKTSIETSSGIGTSSALSTRCSEAADSICKVLTNAGIRGEDTNGNHVLDNGEDTNRDGVLQADWSLANGATAGSLTFNVIGSDYTWSAPITFSVVNGVLRQTQGGQVLEICRNVSSLTFTRSGDLIDFALTLSAADRTNHSWTCTAKRRVNVRN